MAKGLHVKPNTVSRYENGVREPTIDIVIKLAGYFHVSTDILLGKDDRTLPEPPLDISEGICHIANEGSSGTPAWQKDTKISLREHDDGKWPPVADSVNSDTEILLLYNQLDESARLMVKGYIHRLLEEKNVR